MSTSFANYLLAAVSTVTIHPVRHTKDKMDILMKSELGLQDQDPRVLWEEDLKPKTSILKFLIPLSNLNKSEIKRITYIKQVPGNQTQIHGAPVFDKECKLKVAVRRTRFQAAQTESQTDTDIELEGDSMLETEGSLGQQDFVKAGTKRAKPVGQMEEKNWEHLFWVIYYHMHELLKEQVQEHNVDGSQHSSLQCSGIQRSHILPFTKITDLRYWSSEFATTSMPDATDSRKPDLILLDYWLRKLGFSQKSWKDVLTGVEITQSDLSVDRKIPLFLGVATKGYLMMWEQPWRRFILLFSISKFKLHAHYMDRSDMVISKPLPIVTSPERFVDMLNTVTLGNRSSLGFDPTIHICNSCNTIPTHADLPNGFDAMLPGAIGWVYDNDENVYWIMDILWKSCDCWVNEDVKDVEIQLLKAVEGIPNVVQLKKYWDVLYDGKPDSTSRIRSHCLTFKFETKIHRRILLTPCRVPLTHFNDVPELIGVFRDLVVAHKAMVGRRVLYGDLSPNNTIIYQGKGYFIDFDHAKFLNDDGKADPSPHGTGTVPYISFRVLRLMGDGHLVQHMPCDNLESLFYILLEFTVIYLGPKGILAPQPSPEALRRDTVRRWAVSYENMTQDGLTTSSIWKWEFINGLADPPLITLYFLLCCPLLEEWHCMISLASSQSTALSHDTICNILMRGLSMISQQLSQIPPPALPAPLSTPEPTIALSPPPAPPSAPESTIAPLPPDISIACSSVSSVKDVFLLHLPPVLRPPYSSLNEESQACFSLAVLESLQFEDEEAQLKKAGEILMAPARQRKGRGAVEISDSEVNPMAPSQQLKKGKKKADTNFLPCPVEDNDSQSNTQRCNPFLHMAGPDDRFGFKSSSTDKQDPQEATQPIGRSSKKVVGGSIEDEARKDRMWDLDERDELENDELENDADEHDHNDRPSEDEDSLLRDMREASVDRMALCGDEDNEGNEDGDTQMDPDQGDFDSRDSGNDTHHEATDTFDVLERHQTKNGRRKAPSPTHLAHACVPFCLLTNKGPPIHVKLAQGLVSIHPALDLVAPPSNEDLVAPPSNEYTLRPLLGAWPLDARLTEYHLKKPHRPMCGRGVHLHTSLFLVQSPLVLPPFANCLLVGALQLSLWFLPANCPPLVDGLRHSLCPGILLSQIEHLLPLLVQADLTLKVPHLFNAANLEAAFLQAAKLEMRLQAILLHPLPVHQEAVILAQEVLGAVLWTYHTKKVKLDKGYFPEYKVPMSRLLCDDLFTFRTELKKIVISIVKQSYGIFSKGNSVHKERVSAAAAKLLKTGEYLRLPDSSEVSGNLVVRDNSLLTFTGKIYQFCVTGSQGSLPQFYYGNGKKALKTKGVLTGFCDSGTDKVPDLTADTCRADFNLLQKSVDKLMTIPERRAELEEMLKEWAEEGMMGELRNDWDSAAGSDDINIII
ncbi:hypothetical protein BD769DRAFT_1392006 [Suillus cothurnatus]|nr:hypothetical protein BD769DRAFT_1392006 [Suillus cothurnatus]